MSIYAPWFPRGEYLARVARVQAALRAAGQDALLAFLPESVTWLTGYFTRAYGTFQFAIIPASGEPVLVARDVEAYYLDSTCVFPARFLWTDSDAPMAVGLHAITATLGRTPRLAVELSAWVLNAARYLALREALPGAVLEDAGPLVARMRLIKSPAEIAYQRAAARAAEAGMRAGIGSARAGATEREMAAEICAAMIRAGSDLPGPGVLSSGERAFHLHGGYSDRVLARGDIVQLECTPNVRHYHARFMRPMKVGEATEEEHRTVERLVAIQDAAIAAVAPGVPAAVPDAIYREGVLSAGLRETYTNKTFYSVGLLLQPNGGEPLEAAPGCDWRFAPGMTFHTYVLAKGFGMSETITITETGIEKLTQFPRQLFVT
ncbi:Xaa-Pro peptidase family protein [Roseomonas sp. GC11]|uniref:M24 family metallopeptidase n=1 Tax=Roseomonas sp. GC11 TaxID=2950546 RepID=UPI002109F4AE|nr:Xaa-Pro peptidase family protein [Roseomonas sp. GC11]MCQ4159335.1 Xaa-Pro peptidase family protein [Roseomonas sp. GC11]